MTENEQNPMIPPQEMAFSPLDRVIPKCCTSINMAALKTGNVILTLLFNEPTGGNAALIDRVVIDHEMAKSLHETLGNFLKEMENAKNTGNSK